MKEGYYWVKRSSEGNWEPAWYVEYEDESGHWALLEADAEYDEIAQVGPAIRELSASLPPALEEGFYWILRGPNSGRPESASGWEPARFVVEEPFGYWVLLGDGSDQDNRCQDNTVLEVGPRMTPIEPL